MEYFILADGKPGCAVGHQALALGFADRLAQVGLARKAIFALTAFRRVERDDVVALFQRLDPPAHLDDNACALVAEDSREQAFRVLAGTGELVGVADAGRFDLDQAFAFLRALQGDGFDGKWLARLIGDGSACFHDDLPDHLFTMAFFSLCPIMR